MCASLSRRSATQRCTPRSPRSKPGPAMIAALKTASPAPRSALTPKAWPSISLPSRSPTSGASSLSDRPPRTKRLTSARSGRPPAAGSRPFSVPAPTRSTPTTCILISNSTAQAAATAFASRSGVLRDAIAKGPVLLFDLDEANKDVLSTKAECGREPVGDRLVKRLLLLDRPALVPGDLDNQQVLCAADVEIVRIEDQIPRIVLTDHVKAVVLRHADADQRFTDDAADRLAISGLLALAQIDANERHGLVPDFCTGREVGGQTSSCFRS